MKKFIYGIVCVLVATATSFGFMGTTQAASLTYENVFTPAMKVQFEAVADRIQTLAPSQQDRVYNRINRFKITYDNYPTILSMLDYIVDASMMEDLTIPSIAMQYTDLSILVDLLVEANLDETLSAEGMNFTVLAPTNDALTQALDTLNMTLEELKDDQALLTSILQTHVIADTLYSDEIVLVENGTQVPSVQGTRLTINNQGTVMIDAATPILTDSIASNGVIHVIDEVLLPDMLRPMDERSMTIADIVMTTTEFSVLLDLVVEADLAGTLMDEDQSLTVFAPTNQAFMTFLEENNLSLEQVRQDTQLLTDILLYHIIPGSYNSQAVAQLDNGTMVETLQGNSLTVSTVGALMVDDARIVSADHRANNGIVHAIDTVLTP